MPATPVTVHVPVPLGVRPVVGPETVAVKVKVEPRAAVGWSVVTRIAGVRAAIVKLAGALTACGK